MNELERAAHLAEELDLLLSRSSRIPQKQGPDQPLLQFARVLHQNDPFAPAPHEQAQLRRMIEPLAATQRNPAAMKKSTFVKIMQAVLLIALAAGVFLLTSVLISRRPVTVNTGQALTLTPSTPTPEAMLTPTAVVERTFPAQIQTANGLDLELRDLMVVGSSLRASLCYLPPRNASWRLEGVELEAQDKLFPFYPGDAGIEPAGTDGKVCEHFIAEDPGVQTSEAWTIMVKRLVSPLEFTPGCEKVSPQLAQDVPGLSIRCDASGKASGYSIDQIPDDMNFMEAAHLVQMYMGSDVRSGPWSFAIHPADVVPQDAAVQAGTVVVPAACNQPSTLRSDPLFAPSLTSLPTPAGIAGEGVLKSGPFSFAMSLVCDPGFGRLNNPGEGQSEINGLGVQWAFTNEGETTQGEVTYYSGLWPFVLRSGGGGSLESHSSMSESEGLVFPGDARPDFSQGDVPLRFLVRVKTPDGNIEGAALAFNLQRAPEGYRPVDVKVEALTDAERQTVDSDLSAPLPYPTLSITQTPLSIENQDLLNLMDRWQDPLRSSPGWVHTRTRTEMPAGNDLYAGLKEYFSNDWFQLDAQGMIITSIHIDSRPDGTPLQQVASQNGKTTNLTFGDSGGYTPYALDLAYSVKETLKAGDSVKRTQTLVNGKTAILLSVPGAITRREAVDAQSGAWLYSETVAAQSGDDPFTGGNLDTRLTVETAERVDAPPAEALALLGKEFSGYTAPAPYGTPAPQGFDPSHSKLTHQSVPGDDFNTPGFWYGDLYADGYLLGRIDFGNVPGGFCDRSADGSKLAFNYILDTPSGSPGKNSLRWLDLRAIQTVHQPAPQITNLGTLSWSPTEEQLAFFGCKPEQKDCGLYLFDPALDQVKMLLPDVYTSWEPIWKPDGSQIAFVNTATEAHDLYVVDIHSGMVVYQGKFDTDAWQTPADSPTLNWGLSFPREGKGNHCFGPLITDR